MIRSPWLVVLLIARGTAAAQPPPPEAPPAPTIHFDPDAVVEEIAAAMPGLERVVKATFRRGRRAISIGPTVGVYGAAIPSINEFDTGITFGLGVELFKIPVMPTMKNFKALVRDRAKAKLKRALVDTSRGRPPDPFEVQRMAREAWEEAIVEILGLASVTPRRMERPKLSLALEGDYRLVAGTWIPRFRAGIGVWRLTVAASVATAFTEPEISVFAGAEIAVHVLTSKGPRASVFDLFLRGDLELRHRDLANSDTYVVGARFLFDVL